MGMEIKRKGNRTNLDNINWSVSSLQLNATAELIAWNVAVAKSNVWNLLNYVDAVDDAIRKWSDMLYILLKWLYKKTP